MNFLEIAKAEEFEALKYGQKVMSKKEFIKEVKKYGYKIDNSMSFYYTNSANKTTYKAFSCAVTNKQGLRYSNIYNKDKKEVKQSIKRFLSSVFVRENDIIWEIC